MESKPRGGRCKSGTEYENEGKGGRPLCDDDGPRGPLDSPPDRVDQDVAEDGVRRRTRNGDEHRSARVLRSSEPAMPNLPDQDRACRQRSNAQIRLGICNDLVTRAEEPDDGAGE